MAADEVLHIALGDTAGGLLEEACRLHQMPGVVVAIPDDLSHGPLGDGRARAAYFRQQRVGHDPSLTVPDDVFESWRTLLTCVERSAPSAIIAWNSDAVSDMIFLRMAGWWLRDVTASVESVNVTPQSGWCGVGVHEPEELRLGFEKRIRLGALERRNLADDFVRIRDLGDGVHRFANGEIVALPADHFDAMIFALTSGQWQRAVSVVGHCLAEADKRDCIGDLFFSWRLRTMVESSLLEAEGDQSYLRGYRVRRVAAG